MAVAGGSGEERSGVYLVAEGAERVDWKRLGGHSTCATGKNGAREKGKFGWYQASAYKGRDLTHKEGGPWI